MNRRRTILALLTALVLMSLLSVLYARQAFLFPAMEEGVPVRCTADAPPLPVGEPITVLVWNVQFAGSRHYTFFYDYGEQVSVPLATVHETLEGIAAAIAQHDPDIVLLQEVDRGARRTGYVDEHQWLLDKLGYPCDASTPYWRAPYVPHPPQEALGKVELHLSAFSKYRIDDATRVRLPQIRESFLRQQFNLKRAALELWLPTASGGKALLVDTHLSAFSLGDGTKARQFAILDQRLDGYERDKIPWLIAGDFNSLPPGDHPDRLPELDRKWYAEKESGILPLLKKYKDPVGDRWEVDPTRFYTYLRMFDEEPDRTLDYVIHGRNMKAVDYEVLHQHNDLSDHLPLLFTFTL